MKAKRRSSTARRFHRSLGAAAAVFVVFMVVSGMAINHSKQLGLSQQSVTQSTVLDWYGLAEPGQVRSFAVADRWLSFADGRVYLGAHFVGTLEQAVGAVLLGELIVAAGRTEVLLIGPGGEVIERMPWTADASQVRAVGTSASGKVVADTAAGLWQADENLLRWQPLDATSVTPAWSEPAPTPSELKQAISRQFQSSALTVERLVLDFHSGRVFGPVGVIVYDLLALGIAGLALSGLLLWVRSRRNGRR